MRARELILSGRLLPAAEALDWGLVSQVLSPEDLLPAAQNFSATVARRSPLAVANAKQTLNAAFHEGTGTQAGLRLEREVTARYCLTSVDAREGLNAFAEKRPPAFVGR
jgi:enoyl-CoA hydratase